MENSYAMFQIKVVLDRGGSRTAATSKMELFVKCPILDAAAVLDPALFDFQCFLL